MALWKERGAIYKVALILSYVTFLVYGMAFGIPFWFGKDEGIRGLWTISVGDDDSLDKIKVAGFGEGGLGAWFDGVRGCWVGGLFFFLVAVLYSVVENCCCPGRRDYGVNGVLVFLAGLSGAAGIIVTAIEIHGDDQLDTFRWGFILAGVAAAMAIILGPVLILSRGPVNLEKSQSSRTADYVYGQKQQPSYNPEYINPGYRGDELPLVNSLPQSVYRGGNGYGTPPSNLDQPPVYNPYGYKDHRHSNQSSMGDSADLSNGFTSDIIQAEHSLGRRRDDFGKNGGRNDLYGNGRAY